MASIMAFIAVRAAERPAALDHPYGHGRAENLAAYTEGILLLIAATIIGYEAVQRLRHPTPVEAGTYALVLLLVVLALEAGRTLLLRRIAAATGSPAMLA